MPTPHAVVPGTRIKDYAGMVFNLWTVLGYDHTRGHCHYWLCRCKCGCERTVVTEALRSGASRQCRSCGAKTHGGSKTPEYQIWRGIIQRCTNTKSPGYARYGARGISVCCRWRDNFPAFMLDIGTRPSAKHSIDRIDNDGNYEPSNCRWATKKQQERNKRSNHLIIHNGKTQTIAQWAEEVNVPRLVLYGRIGLGWSMKQAIETPVRNGKLFSDVVVRQIRLLASQGDSRCRISDKLGLPYCSVSDVVAGRSYTHIT